MMGHPNRLHFFATQFLVLSWILKLTPCSEQPTWIPLPADEDAPHCHGGELRRTYLYGTSECASQITPLLSLRCHRLTPWLPGTLSSIDSAIFPRIPDIKPRQTIATLSGLGGTSMMGHPNRLHFFATQQSLDTGIVPRDWKTGKVIPVFKKGDRSSPASWFSWLIVFVEQAIRTP
ncbi:uncharacterized protein [Dermacentor albipictus]|uniref:uncharacterized protein n=1 Tax=Dermacentor albipictus TaxID=60249 RepID=UPI0038FD3596